MSRHKRDIDFTKKRWFVIETHPFTIQAHRMMVELSVMDATMVKIRNPELNVRDANDYDRQDPLLVTTQHQDISWEDKLMKELV